MNIQEALTKLKMSAKMTDAEIGRAVCCPQPTITRLRNGVHKETTHSRGEAIFRLVKEKGLFD